MTSEVNSQGTDSSGGGNLIWAKSAGGVSASAVVNGITALSDNSTAATGYFFESVKFGQGELNQTILTSVGFSDIFIALYNPDGTLAWAKRAGGNSGNPIYYEGGYGITSLSDNSIVVTGMFAGSAIFGQGEQNETVLTVSAGGWDIFIARYNPDGTLVWAKCAGGPSDDQGNGITTLSDDSTVVTGIFKESATFGKDEPNQTILISGGIGDVFIARYNPDGTLAWAKHAESPSVGSGLGITALSDNSTVVTGMFLESATFGPGELNQTILTSNGSGDFFIASYNPDGTLHWAKSAGGVVGDDGGTRITALSENSTVVTGFFQGSVTFGPGEPNQTVLTSAGSYDVFTARYNPDGTLAWAKRSGGASNEYSYGISALSDDSTVVTGPFEISATFGPDEPNKVVLTSRGDFDCYITRYNPDGTLAWAKRAGGIDSDEGSGITALSDNSVVVIGTYVGSATFGLCEPNEIVLTASGETDIFIARFAP
ncbi:MAG: hypothetical protein NTY09_15530 [bacterium]|nr:hypothetical protein [bacterium]